jgi:hypothetical protein
VSILLIKKEKKSSKICKISDTQKLRRRSQQRQEAITFFSLKVLLDRESSFDSLTSTTTIHPFIMNEQQTDFDFAHSILPRDRERKYNVGVTQFVRTKEDRW